MSHLAIRQSAITAACVTAWFCYAPALLSDTPSAGAVITTADAVFIFFQDPDCPHMTPMSINVFQIVTGSCQGPLGGHSNGFIRDADGNFTIFNPPGAVDTYPMSINASGAIAGSYSDGVRSHGFLRAPDGTFTSFDYPASIATFSSAINGGGTITGSFYFGDLAPHGFVRAPDGTITTVTEMPGSKGTVPMDINEPNYVTGSWFQPISDIPQGFVEAPDRTNMYFSPGFSGTIPFGINRSGVIAGIWRDPVSYHGFVRAADGTITSYTYPGSLNLTSPIFQSRADSHVFGGINREGYITATFFNTTGQAQGFVRSPDGTITTFDLGPGDTYATAINDYAIVTGYLLRDDLEIGYLRVPNGIIAH